MSFAELVLRLGVTFVSWMMIYMHFIMLLSVGAAPCNGADVAAWKVSLFTALLALGAAFSVTYSHAIPGMARTFRYFALPLLILLPWAAWLTLPYLSGTTFGTLDVCAVTIGAESAQPIPGWQRAWAPVQLAVLGALAVGGWRAWKPVTQSRA